jgi:hypothetical protein
LYGLEPPDQQAASEHGRRFIDAKLKDVEDRFGLWLLGENDRTHANPNSEIG